jgi:uncharacterized protein (DUF2249 family)
MITGDLTVAQLIETYPQLIDVLADYHPHFGRLRNRVLRRVMAPRVTIEQAARMAGVAPEDLVTTLRRAAGDAASATERVLCGIANEEGVSPTPRPHQLAGVLDSRRTVVDVRDDVRRGEEPFAKIMAAVRTLGSDRVLVLRAPFEPIPLYDVLAKRGFAHWTQRHAPDDWAVWFYREAVGGIGETTRDQAAVGAPPTLSGNTPHAVEVIDVRGLEPPQPMLRVLEALERLEPEERLEVLHDRRPVFLYPQLDDRGFLHETDEPEPGLVRIVIRRVGMPS